MPHDHFVQTAAAIVAVRSIARTARRLTFDDFPPVVWLRDQVVLSLSRGERRSRWLPLTNCPFCLAPYLSAGMALWVWLSKLDTAWWWINGVWAAAYVAAIVVARDEAE